MTAVSNESQLLKRSGDALSEVRSAQRSWSRTAISERLAVFKRLGAELATRAEPLAHDLTAANPRRTHVADTLAAEVIPLAAASRFLRRQARRILRPRRVGTWGRPAWLWGVSGAVRREPWGVVLIVAPSNYPLLLPGVQAIQALAAGNAVVLKPGRGGSVAAQRLVQMLEQSGLPNGLIQVTDESSDAATGAIHAGVDKVVLTGSTNAGRAVLEQCAQQLIPATVELSGCDAVWVGPGADLDRVAAALAYGMRLNAGGTCLAPHRIFVYEELHEELLRRVGDTLATLPAMTVGEDVAQRLEDAAATAVDQGATRVRGRQVDDERVEPYLIRDARPAMSVMRQDLFGPMLAVCSAPDQGAMLEADAACGFGLGIAAFGQCERVINEGQAGNIIVEDVIVPTADPRLPFGGWGDSGFGVTRGVEGLLAMTRPKVVTRNRSGFRPHYDPPTAADPEMLAAYLQARHGSGLACRYRATRRLIAALMRKGKQA